MRTRLQHKRFATFLYRWSTRATFDSASVYNQSRCTIATHLPDFIPLEVSSMRFSDFHLPRSFVAGGLTLAALPLSIQSCFAELKLPNIFGNQMVVQREQENPIWGKADANAQVTVVVGDRKADCTADAEGNWRTMLPSLPTGGPYQIKVTSGSDTITLDDVLSGEVWICSGQSNMQWTVSNSEDFELEKLSANYPKIRMINFPQVGSQTQIWSHEVNWQVSNSQNVGRFSAVGYFFGRQLHQTLDVPIGLINNAWGGSAAEAWIDQKTLSEDSRFAELMERWKKDAEEFETLQAKTERTEQEQMRLANLKKSISGNQRPGNIFHGVLESHLGYGVRGAIWYQGESNAGRAYQYRDLFPLMITHWRQHWGKDFPFYWVQLADYREETTEPVDSDWAELREAQTLTLDKLPNVGQAVIIDIGEGKDIHPRNKVEVGRRLARLALKNEYGYDIAADAPRYSSMEIDGSSIVLTFDHVGNGWRPFDVAQPLAFTIAGEDKQFYKAKAEILSDKRIRVSSEQVSNPVAVRYAWANNPVVNMFNQNDLPLTPFRTDDWPGVTVGRNR